jgi:hypothetical protein
MAPTRANRCWICGRAPDEVSASVGRPGLQETELDKKFSRMTDMSVRFSRVSEDWMDIVPEQYRSLDFNFVFKNQAQFKSMRFISEVEDARMSLVMPLQVAVANARNGTEASIGGAKIAPSEKPKRDMLLKEIDAFERRARRHINGTGGNDSMPHGFDGMKLGQGIGFLREIGMLYFSVQEKLLEAEKEEEMSRKPTFAVSVARVDGLPGEVPVCTICQNLIISLVPA